MKTPSSKKQRQYKIVKDLKTGILYIIWLN